jgi:hypothetical protein
MLGHLYGTAGDRKLRLFACACCRRIWPCLADERSREAVAVAERYADGLVDGKGLTASGEAAAAVWQAALGPGDRVEDLGAYAAWATVNPGNATQVARVAAISASAHLAATPELPDADRLPTALAECQVQAALLRDLFGNPFGALPSIDPSWLTAEVVGLADAAYSNRLVPSGHLDPALLAALAQALADAGCTDAGLLGHLRSGGPHVRGCHGVDAVLKKE